MTEPKFYIGDNVHVDGACHISTVVFIEIIGKRYVYTVQDTITKALSHAQENDLIKVD